MNRLTIAYIGGGSKGWAWKFMSDLVLERDLTGTVKLYDIDVPAANMNEIIGNKLNDSIGAKTRFNYIAVDSLQEALTEADFVVISITPGTLETEMRSDIHTPEPYGIYQSVGDTVGVGGIIRALRTIPMYIEIAEAIKNNCPNAWVINYTNPMTICVRTLYEVFPEIKAFGCCHEVFSTQTILAHVVKEKFQIPLPERHEIEVNVQGINHFTWITEAYYRGHNLLPLYEEFVDKYYETGYRTCSEEEITSPFFSLERVKFDLFKRYHVIAAAGDRHLVEFLPRDWYLKNPEQVKKWQFKLTTIEDRLQIKKERDEQGQKMVDQNEPLDISPSDEEGVKQIKALLGLAPLVTNVNLPNQGQIPYLPIGAVVETNALFRSNKIQPVCVGKLNAEVVHLMMGHVLMQEALIKAFFKQDKQAIFNIWLSDPMAKTLDLDSAKQLFAEMVEKTKHYLPEWMK